MKLLDRTNKQERKQAIETIGFLISFDDQNLFYTDHKTAIAKLIELQGKDIYPKMEQVTTENRKQDFVQNLMREHGFVLVNAVILICRVTGDIFYLVNKGFDSDFGKFLDVQLYVMQQGKLKLLSEHKKHIIKQNGLFINFDNLKIGLREFSYYYAKIDDNAK